MDTCFLLSVVCGGSVFGPCFVMQYLVSFLVALLLLCLAVLWLLAFESFTCGAIGFFFLFCCFTSQVNSYGHCGTVSSPNHTFSWAGLNKRKTSNSCTNFRL